MGASAGSTASDSSGGYGGFGGLGIGNPGSYGGQSSVGAPGGTGGAATDSRTGYGGFGGLGIGNPGSYGGKRSVGAPGFGGGYDDAGGVPSYGGYESEVAQAIANMPVIEQEKFFREVVEPALDKRYGWQGRLAGGIYGFGINTGLNAIVPGLGSIARVTGLTKALTEKINDMGLRQSLRDALGLSRNYAGVDDDKTLQSAIEKGATGKEVIDTINQQIALSGGSVMGFWEDIIGKSSASASRGAARTAANYQQQALNYLKERDIVPRVFSEGAMKRLGGFYGLDGGEEKVMDEYYDSPIYANLQAGKEQGEDAILRNYSATGGLRSGNVQEALYDYNIRSEQDALNQYLYGLDRFTGYPSYATNIAGHTAGIGQTLAAGQIGAAQARQTGTGNLISMGAGVLSGLGGYSGIKEVGSDILDLGSDIVSGIASLF